jgi:sugar phosphate isomerase/epimerase
MEGISTCWWYNRDERPDKVLEQVLEMGLDGIELEYRITESFFREMRPLLGDRLKVLSIHNFFPKPEGKGIQRGGGDLFLLSSSVEAERLEAVQYTIRSMEHASDLGALAVILHMGRVEMDYPREDIFDAHRRGVLRQDEGVSLIRGLLLKRKRNRLKHLDAALKSLDTLNKRAEKLGVHLGVENRYHLNEIPDFHEIGIILKAFRGGRVRYWHDLGHAQAQENMGIIPQRDLLTAYGNKLVGIHIHDIRGLDDHLSPGQGEMDFQEIQPFLGPSIIKIFEIHSRVNRVQLDRGIAFFNAY